jgi:Integron Cassette Protein Hfx_Cass5
MRKDAIEAVGIDEQGSLWVKPATAAFLYVYREAMEVGWDVERRCLYSPTPREWSYAAWFKRIIDAAREQGVELELNHTTSWSGIEPDLREAITHKD